MPGMEYSYYNMHGGMYPPVTPPTPTMSMSGCDFDYEQPSPPPSPPPARSSTTDSETCATTPRSIQAESMMGEECGQPKSKFPEGVRIGDLQMWGYSADIPMPTLPFMNEGEGVITVPKKKQIEIVKGKCIHCKRLVQPGIVKCPCKESTKNAEQQDDRKCLIDKLFRNLNSNDIELHADILSTMEGDKDLLAERCISEIQQLVSLNDDHDTTELSSSSSSDVDSSSREHLIIHLIGLLHSKGVLTSVSINIIASILLSATHSAVQSGDKSPEVLTMLMKLINFTVLEATIYRQLLQLAPKLSTGLAFRIDDVCSAWDFE